MRSMQRLQFLQQLLGGREEWDGGADDVGGGVGGDGDGGSDS